MRRLQAGLLARQLLQPLLRRIPSAGAGLRSSYTAAPCRFWGGYQLAAMTTAVQTAVAALITAVKAEDCGKEVGAEEDSTSVGASAAAAHKRKQPDTDADATSNSASSECALQVRDRRLQLQSHKDVQELLASHGVQCEQVIKRRDKWDAFVVFADTEQRQAARAKIEAATGETGKPLFRQLTDIDKWTSRANQEQRKKKHMRSPAAAGTASASDSDDATPDPPPQPPQSILDVVTPYHSLPYDQQLKRKRRTAVAALKQTTRGIRALDRSFKPLQHTTTNNPDLLCDLQSTVPAPQLTAYRNKCEFSCGRNGAGDRQCGFLLGRYADGLVHVEAVAECVHVSDEAKRVVASFTDYMRASAWEVYDKATHTGVWRLVTVRNNRQSEVMVIVQLDDTSMTDSDRTALHQSLIDHFAAHCPVQSLWVQHWRGINNQASPTDAPPILLFGASTIVEQLSGHAFHISPSSFFQVNTQAAELLYSLVADYAQLRPPAVLLDVCCGTGTIGQVVGGGREGVRVVGLELVEAACDDAKANAQHNGMTNCDYVAGKVEDTLTHTFLRSLHTAAAEPLSLVAVLDPPRGGLHGSVTRVLRECVELRRLVYVSCNPKSLADNLVTLCQRESKRVKGRPFVAQKAVTVDLFPHTDHCEMVVLLERE